MVITNKRILGAFSFTKSDIQTIVQSILSKEVRVCEAMDKQLLGL